MQTLPACLVAASPACPPAPPPTQAVAAEEKDCRVLNLGAGAGLHAMLALRAGAHHVTAVERWLYLALACKESLAANGVSPGPAVHKKTAAQVKTLRCRLHQLTTTGPIPLTFSPSFLRSPHPNSPPPVQGGAVPGGVQAAHRPARAGGRPRVLQPAGGQHSGRG